MRAGKRRKQRRSQRTRKNAKKLFEASERLERSPQKVGASTKLNWFKQLNSPTQSFWRLQHHTCTGSFHRRTTSPKEHLGRWTGAQNWRVRETKWWILKWWKTNFSKTFNSYKWLLISPLQFSGRCETACLLEVGVLGTMHAYSISSIDSNTRPVSLSLVQTVQITNALSQPQVHLPCSAFDSNRLIPTFWFLIFNRSILLVAPEVVVTLNIANS